MGSLARRGGVVIVFMRQGKGVSDQGFLMAVPDVPSQGARAIERTAAHDDMAMGGIAVRSVRVDGRGHQRGQQGSQQHEAEHDSKYTTEPPCRAL